MSVKKLLCVILAALSLGFITSCRHDDPEVTIDEQKQQAMEEMREQILSMRAGIDLSELFTGETALGVWVMSPDSTFIYFHVSGID